jgi:hypothetical protein
VAALPGGGVFKWRFSGLGPVASMLDFDAVSCRETEVLTVADRDPTIASVPDRKQGAGRP